MLLIPAIDLKDGQCVRLKQGEMDDATVFSEDPGAMARHWLDAGARRLHLVDLNGAFAGKPKNGAAIRAITDVVGDGIPAQLGGGIRDLDTIEHYLDNGISYVIIGTAAVKNPGFLHDACSAFPGHIVVGIDAKDGKVAVDGWAKPPATTSWTGEAVRGLRGRVDHLHRYRPRRPMLGPEYRGHRGAGARAAHPGHRLRWGHRPGDSTRCARSPGGIAGRNLRAARFTMARWTSPAAAGARTIMLDGATAMVPPLSAAPCSKPASFPAWTSPMAAWSRA